MAALPYFYDAQLRRILVQMIRIFSGFRYLTGVDSTGNRNYETVPVVYGDGDTQAQQLLINNSENTQLSVPRFAVYIQNVKPAALSRGSWRGNIDELVVTERHFDVNTNQYTDEIGDTFRVQRLQPTPLDINIKVDLWTSNTDQKFQIFEQVYTLFNPDLILQTTSSPLDWTALQRVMLDDINWEDNGVNRGTDETSDVLSFNFTVESYINPPARVKKAKLIETIIQNIGDALEECDNSANWDGAAPTQEVVTPNEAYIQVLNNNQIILLGPNKNVTDENGNVYSWQHLLDDYGQLTPGVSTIRLRWVSDITDDTQDIIGYITLDANVDNIVDFQVQSATVPLSTQIPVMGVINPHIETPGNNLPAATAGQRYILSTAIGPCDAWGNLTANAQDIVQYDGSEWTVALSVASDTTMEFVQDTSTNQLLKLVNGEWIDAINAYYAPGYFRINL